METNSSKHTGELLPQTRATKKISVTLGTIVGFYSAEHGVLEILQGNTIPTEAPLGFELDTFGFGYLIDAIGPEHKIWPGASEPAFTVIPNFLITGILAILLGILIVTWAVKRIHLRFGSLGILLLGTVAFFFGGGIAPLVVVVICAVTASRIGKPSKWFQSHHTDSSRKIIGKVWPWAFGIGLFLAIFSVFFAIFGYPFTWFLDSETVNALLLVIGYVDSGALIFAGVIARAYDAC